MVKDHSDSDKGNPLLPHRLLFLINSKGSFICTIPQMDSIYHGLCYTSRGALAGTRNSSMGPPHEGSILTTHRTMSERSYHGAISRSWFARMTIFNPNLPHWCSGWAWDLVPKFTLLYCPHLDQVIMSQSVVWNTYSPDGLLVSIHDPLGLFFIKKHLGCQYNC